MMPVTEEIFNNRQKAAYQIAEAAKTNQHKQSTYFGDLDGREINDVTGEELVLMYEGQCGTTACVAGHVWLALDGVKTCPDPLAVHDLEGREQSEVEVFYFAQNALGLTGKQAYKLFIDFAGSTQQARKFMAWLGNNADAEWEAIDAELLRLRQEKHPWMTEDDD